VLITPNLEKAGLSISVAQELGTELPVGRFSGEIISTKLQGHYTANRHVSLNGDTYFHIGYGRTNLPAFNRTYRQICNSLRIE
jgi:hypothetical protein